MNCRSYQGRFPCNCEECCQNDSGGIWFGLAGATLLGLIVAVIVADEMQPVRNLLSFLWESL